MALHDRIARQAGALGVQTELNAAEVFADYAGSSSLMFRELLSHLLNSLTRLRAKQIISDLPLAEFSWASWRATARRASFARRMR